jgi:hypothetical protein
MPLFKDRESIAEFTDAILYFYHQNFDGERSSGNKR